VGTFAKLQLGQYAKTPVNDQFITRKLNNIGYLNLSMLRQF